MEQIGKDKKQVNIAAYIDVLVKDVADEVKRIHSENCDLRIKIENLKQENRMLKDQNAN